ncbi:MAG: hypothetical protein ACYTFY_08085 [Planctomycetota bacterium]|jgi:hypothetical protein
MFTDMEIERYREVAREAVRWFFRNQNTNESPWGGIENSADLGRYIYEYYPATGKCRGAGIWAQALGIMAMDAANIDGNKDYDCEFQRRVKSAVDAGRYLLTLQRQDSHNERNYGGFDEGWPGHDHSFPRDGITGGLGLCALYKMTGDKKYLDSAELFADWYFNNACDEDGWPCHSFDFVEGKAYNSRSELLREAQGHVKYCKGDWQVGGSMFFYYLSKQTGNDKYVNEYMLPNIEGLMQLYRENPVDKVLPGFHGAVPVSFGNDDFALLALLCAYCATKKEEYLEMARERIYGLFNIMDKETGLFPSYGGTFVMGITFKVLKDLEEFLGNTPDPRLEEALKLICKHGAELQAFDYNNLRINGGFWGQCNYGVSKDRIHQRSTGYAAIFYAMMVSEELIPHYHCLGWGYEDSLK